MLGAVFGDLVGSTRESHPTKDEGFALLEPLSHLTDDSILTVAVAVAIVGGRPFGEVLRQYGRAHPAGYGQAFGAWLESDHAGPYGSWGNGSAMRVSACAWLADDLGHAVRLARASAEATHDHPEGVRGAVATVVAIYVARCGWGAEEARAETARASGYDLTGTVDGIRPRYRFDVSCAGSVPQALVCAYESTSLEHAVRSAVSLGGDADTQAAIAGSVAEAMHGIPPHLAAMAWDALRERGLDRDAETVLAAVRPPRAPDASCLAGVTFRDTVEDWLARTGRDTDVVPNVRHVRAWAPALDG